MNQNRGVHEGWHGGVHGGWHAHGGNETTTGTGVLEPSNLVAPKFSPSLVKLRCVNPPLLSEHKGGFGCLKRILKPRSILGGFGCLKRIPNSRSILGGFGCLNRMPRF